MLTHGPVRSILTYMSESLASRGTLWRVASPYFLPNTQKWLDAEIPADVYRFERVQAVGGGQDWHARRQAHSTLSEWLAYYRQALNAVSEPSDGLISVFPQLAAALSTVSYARRDDRPIVSWFFNTNLHDERRRRIASLGLGRIDKFVVHSTIEIETYSSLLEIPEERFHFVPLQYGATIETEAPDRQEPYIFATGSGHRDYKTFFEAVEKLGYPTIVLAGPRALKGLTPPANVEIVDSMSKQQIRRHVRHARVNVVPLKTTGVTVGLVTIVECLRHGCGMVSTARSGIEDYLTDGYNSLLSLPGNAESLATRIEAYWTDDSLRHKLNANALAFAEQNCTDQAAANALVEVLDGVTAAQQRRMAA